jgi:sterol desaturase/sphingolipid hydroxylase (fatty acid hydroxylase superfamily)
VKNSENFSGHLIGHTEKIRHTENSRVGSRSETDDSNINRRDKSRLSTSDKYRTKEPIKLRSAFVLFSRQYNFWLLGIALIFFAAIRFYFYRISYVDLITVLLTLVFQPFVEWLIHIFLLHFKPKRLFSFTYEPLVAKMHRMHHEDPKNLRLVFVPKSVMTALVLGSVVVPIQLLPRTQASTLIVTLLAILLYYEWIHFLIHSSYRPKHKIYKTIWRAHRLHHYRNENYWFGVVTNFADKALGTSPNKSEVPLSPTARSLI